MTEERIFDGRNMTQSELDMMRRIINEVNVEVDIEDGDIVIQAVCDDDHVEQIGHCDLRRVAAHSADIALQDEGEAGVFALAGLFSKCVQIVLNEAEPPYEEQEEAQILGGIVRMFAGNGRENPPEIVTIVPIR
jgi:hypothetical protein